MRSIPWMVSPSFSRWIWLHLRKNIALSKLYPSAIRCETVTPLEGKEHWLAQTARRNFKWRLSESRSPWPQAGKDSPAYPYCRCASWDVWQRSMSSLCWGNGAGGPWKLAREGWTSRICSEFIYPSQQPLGNQAVELLGWGSWGNEMECFTSVVQRTKQEVLLLSLSAGRLAQTTLCFSCGPVLLFGLPFQNSWSRLTHVALSEMTT